MLSTVRSLVLLALVSTLIAASAAISSAATGGSNPPIATVPAVGSRISEEPSSVTLAMRAAVAGPAVVTVKDGSGRVVSEGSTTLLSTNIAVDLKTGLPHGVYTVTYRIDGSPTKGPEGGVFQFAYGSGNPSKNISTWSGYKHIPRETRLPDDAKREVAFEAAKRGKGTPSATPTATVSSPDPTKSPDPTTASDKTQSSGGHTGLWLILIALALAGVATAYVARRRLAQTASQKHADADDVSHPTDGA